MAQVINNQGSVASGETKNAVEEVSAVSGEATSEGSSGKNASTNPKEYGRKKKDALEGKESHKGKEGESEADEGHHGAEKAEGDDSGGHGRQSLQSGQTTVQFSSGGGVGGAASSSLSSLMGLYASSASLARVEGVSYVNGFTQLANLNLRLHNETSNNLGANFFNEVKNTFSNVGQAKIAEASTVTGNQFATDKGGALSSSHSNGAGQNIISSILGGVGAQAAEGDTSTATVSSVLSAPITSVGEIIPVINPNNFFFTSPALIFAFTNLTPSTAKENVPLVSSSQTISGYYTAQSLATSSIYDYTVMSPVSTFTKSTYTAGVEITPSGPLTLATALAPQAPTTGDAGLTLSSSGKIFVNVTSPVSVLLNITTPDQLTPTSGLGLLRIDAGPGVAVSDARASPYTPFIGNPVGSSTYSPTGAVMTITGTELVAGNAITYDLGTASQASASVSQDLAGNVILRHEFSEIGKNISTITTPSAPVFGNFATGVIDIPNGGSVSFTAGNNVLDVYGNLYGIGNSLDVNSAANSSAPSAITLQGNVLAGFGDYWGDFQTLTINQTGTTSANAQNTYNFGSNQLYVDKAVASVLYPDIQTLNLTGAPHNIALSFADNIVQGNQGSDVFYNDIANFSTAVSGSYTGFLNPVTVSTQGNGPVVVTTTDGNGNSISFGDTLYNGGNDLLTNPKAIDTYNFTLLEDANTLKPVVEGNLLLTSFNPKSDALVFQMTPQLFQALDGVNGGGHDKFMGSQSFATNLNTVTTASTQNVNSLNSTFTQYLEQYYPGVPVNGTTITFDNGLGGSISFIETNNPITNFSDIANLSYELTNYNTSAAVTALPTDLIATNTLIPEGSSTAFLYGSIQGALIPTYNNELDNFFTNSLLATYTISGSGVTVASDSLTAGNDPGAKEYIIAQQNGQPTVPTVIIDEFGTIQVTTNTPIFIPLTIVATDQNGHTATTTQMFGFLNAPTVIVGAGEIGKGQSTPSSNILEGGLNSIMIGESLATLDDTPASPGTPLIGQKFSYGSNLIADTSGGGVAYGDFKTFNLTATGTGSQAVASGSSATNGEITGSAFNFNANAFDVTAGTVYGVAQTFSVTAQGGSNNTVSGGSSLNDSGQFDASSGANTFNFDAQTFYGTGTFYGDMQTLNISAQGGSNDSLNVGANSASVLNASGHFDNNNLNFAANTFTINGNVSGNIVYGDGQAINISAIAGSNGSATLASSAVGMSSGTLDISSDVNNNTFTFAPVTVTVQGDAVGETTTVYANIDTLSITVEPTFLKEGSPNITINSSATFSGNQFNFEGATIVGGQGNTIIYADPNFYGNLSVYAYHGFTNPVTVTTTGVSATETLTITSADSLNNSITFGADTFTSSAGSNNYNFTLLEDNGSQGKTGGVEAVFLGFDSINGFKIGADVLTLNVAPNLYNQILKAASLPADTTITGAILDQVFTHADTVKFIHANGNTTIQFYGPLNVNGTTSNGVIGQLTLDGVTVNSFSQLGNSLAITEISPTSYITPLLNTTSVTFDPVFSNIAQPAAFAAFFDTATVNPLSLTYTTSSSLPGGLVLDANGTLDTSKVTAPEAVTLSVSVTDGITILNLPTVTVFVSNASSIYYDNTSAVINGNAAVLTTPAAYEVTAGTVYGSGGGLAGLTLSNASAPASSTSYGSNLIYDMGTTAHAIYGNFASVTDSVDTSLATTPSGLTYTFNANLMNIANGGPTDLIYGNGQSFTLDAPAPSSDTTSATYTFGSHAGNTLMGNTIYGTGTLFGNFQTLTLDSSTGSGSISNNTFNFGNTALTSGFYQSNSDGSNSLVGATGTTNLYPDLQTLVINTSGSAAVPVTGNVFVFGDSTLNGIGPTNFYASVANFGNSDDPAIYGTKGFYSGVSVSTPTVNGEKIVQITDSNSNIIQWGNETYTGSTVSANTYNFTIIGTNTATPQAVMQGFDTVTNFTAADKLIFNLAYPIYNQLAVGSTLTAAGFLAGLTITQTANAAILTFVGGGSLTLDGFGTNTYATTGALTTALTSSITVGLADPVTAIAHPSSHFLVLGQTDFTNSLASFFNTGHQLTTTIDGMTINANGSVTYSPSNTGLVQASVSSITASDPYTTVTNSLFTPVQVVALNAPEINQTGNEQGNSASDTYGVNSYVFVGSGNAIITGGITEIDFTASSDPTNGTRAFSYQPKLIYDPTGNTDTVYGDGQTIVVTNDGSSNGMVNTNGLTFTTGTNFIEATGNLYGNFNTLAMTSLNRATVPSNDTFKFGNDTLVGGSSGANSFFGHLQVFGNSENPASYGSNNFYDGVSVSTVMNLATGENFLTIKDGNSNQITWGNDTYTGGSGVDTYNFTVVGTNTTTPQAVMQGFDTVTNFTSADKLIFNLAYPIYNQLAAGSTLTAAGFLAGLAVTQTANAAVLTFAGGGSLTLDGYGTSAYASPSAVETALAGNITVSLADPITAVANPSAPANNVIILGETDSLNPLSQYFNFGHTISLSFGNITGITDNTSGNINFGTNTGLINTFANSIGVSDSYTSLTTTFTTPVQVVALNAPEINHTGNEQGNSASDTYGVNSYVFVGSGNAIITGGITEIDFTSASDPTNGTRTFAYQPKLIYDPTGNPDTVYGDGQTIVVTNDGSSTGIANTVGLTFTTGTNFIEASGNLYGNFNTLTMTSLNGAAVPNHDTVTFGDNTLVGGSSGANSFYGHLQVFGNSDNPASYGSNNFYDGVSVSTPTVNGEKIVQITDSNSNIIQWGNDTYTGGSGVDTYNFTVVGTNGTTPQAVMQGFDTITNFTAADKLTFNLAYPIYNQLAAGSTLTAAGFLAGLTMTQTANAAVLTFAGGGSLTLDGFGTNTYATTGALTTALTSSITVGLADPVTTNTNPSSHFLVLGQTDFTNSLASFFNTGHQLTTTIDGMTINADGSVTFSPSNTGLVQASVSSITASDPYTTVTNSLSTPVQVVALNAPEISHTGNEQGNSASDTYGVNSYVFLGSGNAIITGGITEIDFTSASDPTNGTRAFAYQPKLIYDPTGNADTVYGDGQTIVITNDGSPTGIANTSGLSLNIAGNYIQATGSLYGNFNVLNLTSTNSAALPSSDIFKFGNDTLVGGSSGANSFFGHLQVFGNSENPASYGSNNFYNGVSVSTVMNLATGENFLTIKDGNSNQITWGNDTYTGGSGVDTYNFTVIGTNGTTPQAVMQGFDTVTNFTAADKLIFNLAYPIYNQLAAGSTLTAAGFLASLTVTQTANAAVLTFAGGGSLTLDGLGTNTYATTGALTTALTSSITVGLADPITAVTNTPAPVNNVIILGATDSNHTLTTDFNFGHTVSVSFGGVSGITEDPSGNINFGANTGIINTTTSSIMINDSYNSATATFTTPVEVLALNGTVINNTGQQTGTTVAEVFIGNGSQIIGGGADINDVAKYGAPVSSTTVTYGDKLIYNNASTGTGSVTGDVQNVNFTSQGATDNVVNGTSPISSTATVSSNLIDFSPTWIFSNVASSTYGTAQNINLTAFGSTNEYTASATPINDVENIYGNTLNAGGNTISASGNAYGETQTVALDAKDGFYSGAAKSVETNTISNTTLNTIGNTVTGNGSASNQLYGDGQTLSITIESPANTAGVLTEALDFSTAVTAANNATSGSATVSEGNSVIMNNTITYGNNTLAGSSQGASLFAGVDKLVIQNNEQVLTNATQPTASSITNNHIIFGNSTETGKGGITNFYGDVANLSNTNFDQNGVTVTDIANGTAPPFVQITDTAGTTGTDSAVVHGNTIQFGNDVMNASTAQGAVNTFNLDLFATTTGSIVGEGNTTINNFGALGASNGNMLNLQLSHALYNDISTFAQNNHITLATSNGVNEITAGVLDSYMAANNGTVSQIAGNTVINFLDTAHDNLGSITLTGVTTDASGHAINSFASLGTNVEITAQGVTTIDPLPNAATVFNVTVPGDTISSFQQNTQVADLSHLGQIVDFQGSLNLNMSSALFKAAGLSDSNTAAQNFQILQNDAATAQGGVAVSTTTANSVTNTVLTFESTSTSGVLNTYGSITLNSTHFNPADPLSAHLTITHH